MGGRRLFRAGPRDYGYYALLWGTTLEQCSYHLSRMIRA